MQNQRLTIVGVVLGIALFLAVNLLAGPTLRGVRADLTEQKLYTISQGTRNIVGGLEEDITLRYFFTRKLAQEEAEESLLPYADRVLEMLEQYEAASGGKITLEVIDPVAFSEEEEAAVRFGIPGRACPCRATSSTSGWSGPTPWTDGRSSPSSSPAARAPSSTT